MFYQKKIGRALKVNIFAAGREATECLVPFTCYHLNVSTMYQNYGLPSVWPYPATLSNRSVPGRVSKRIKSLKH